jgi:predicted ATPase
VLEAVRELTTALLEACPSLTVLATSRERLAVPAEQTCRLAPLPMPDPAHLDEAGRTASVVLFADRARRVRPDFDLGPQELTSAVGIIRALDGLPLAIELAAGRLASMTVQDVEARLDRALDLLGRGSAPDPGGETRHRTLRAAIAWSYDLLPHDEQRLFRHLSVFADGFDLATAEAVAHGLGITGDPVAALAHLVDASMLSAEFDVPRYRMLDSLRRFGLDRLRAEGELDAATRCLRRWAVELARWFEATAETDAELEADATLRRELGNLRAAWTDARAVHDLDTATEIALRLYWAGAWRDLAELWRWALELAADDGLEGHPRQAAVLGLAADACWFSAGDLDRAEALARRACELATRDYPTGWAMSRCALANVTLFRGRYDESRDLSIEAGRGTLGEAEAYAQAALAAGYGSDLEAARELLVIAKAKVTSPSLRAWTRYVEGELEGLSGDWPAAEDAYREAIDTATGTGAQFVVGVAWVGLVSALTAGGAIGDALHGYQQLIDRWERTGGWTQQWTTLRNLADLLERLGDAATARELRDAADAAPEAAAVGPTPAAGKSRRDGLHGVPDRQRVLDLARTAIDKALAGS